MEYYYFLFFVADLRVVYIFLILITYSFCDLSTHSLTPMIDTYKRKISAPEYLEKVPESVQVVNAEKLASYEAEMDATMSAFNAFNKLK